MKVTDEQYETFRKSISDVRDMLSKLERKIGNVPMTIRFMRAIDQLYSNLSQMYFEEIKGKEEKDFDREISALLNGRKDDSV